MNIRNMSRKHRIIWSIGIVLCTCTPTFTRLVHLPDFFRGILTGCGLGILIAFGVLNHGHGCFRERLSPPPSPNPHPAPPK